MKVIDIKPYLKKSFTSPRKGTSAKVFSLRTRFQGGDPIPEAQWEIARKIWNEGQNRPHLHAVTDVEAALVENDPNLQRILLQKEFDRKLNHHLDHHQFSQAALLIARELVNVIQRSVRSALE